MDTIKHVVVFSIFVITPLFSGCELVPPQQSDITQLQRHNWHWDAKNRHYTLLARSAINDVGEGLLTAEPVDVGQFCWSYTGLDREARLWFWSDLLASMSKLESNHNEELQYTERFADAQGHRVVSRGLLQLSIESSHNYQCGLSRAEQLHSPEENIRCATRILNKWVTQDRAIGGGNAFTDNWQGGARYWSVLRNSEKRQLIQQRMQNEAYCHSSRFDRLAYRR